MNNKIETEISYDEGTLMDIANKIFKNEPEYANRYRLEFDTGYDGLEDVHKDLLMFFTHGMKVLYGDSNGQVDLSTLSKKQLNKMNRYMNMIGIVFHHKVYKEDEYDKMMFENFIITDKKNLDDYRFKIKCNTIIYVIYFSLIT